MSAKNDITGDNIKTKGTYSQQGRDNWDTIFGKNKEKVEDKVEDECISTTPETSA